jgi:CheY-like chemotaxis protein
VWSPDCLQRPLAGNCALGGKLRVSRYRTDMQKVKCQARHLPQRGQRSTSAMTMTSALRLVTTNPPRGIRPTQSEEHSLDHLRLPAASRVKPPRRVTIMVVEDDVVVGRALANALEFAGYRVRIAATGGAACALQPRVHPDLIILDLILPDMDGLVLTTTLKAMTDAPIIICSARHGQVDRVLGLRLGAVDFVAKPFDLDDLQARIEALVPVVRQRRATISEPTRTTRRRQA